MADQIYDLAGQTLKYKRYRNVAIVIFLVGLAMLIAGSIMLGIGIKKKHDADNQKTIISSEITCSPIVVVTTKNPNNNLTSIITTKKPLIQTTTTNPPIKSSTLSTISSNSSSSKKPSSTTASSVTCPPCHCPSTIKPSTSRHTIPTDHSIPTSTPGIHPITIATTHKIKPVTMHTIPVQTTHRPKTTTKNYPDDPNYYPCLSHIVIVFEAATNVDDDIYKKQINFITKNLIHGYDKNWTNPERVAYAAFERNNVNWEGFYHFYDLRDLENNITNVQRISGKSGYQKIFDLLVNNITYYDTNNQFVNTIIFTSNDNSDEIYQQYNNARIIDGRGKLLIVTTTEGIKNQFLPWTNGVSESIFYIDDEPSDVLETYDVIQQFKCPTGKQQKEKRIKLI